MKTIGEQGDIPDDLKAADQLPLDILGMLCAVQSIMVTMLQTLNHAIDALEDQYDERDSPSD